MGLTALVSARRNLHLSACWAALLLSGVAPDLVSQEAVSTGSLRDTTLTASSSFEAGGFRRLMMGENYRHDWATPITVPILDLRTFGGGIRPIGTGGGLQTLNLRFEASDGTQYVFRSVRKDVALPDLYRHTIIWFLMADARSSLHPAAALPGNPILTAAGVLHPRPVLFVMPDDSLLGQFRAEFAGTLGTIEERPAANGTSHHFAEAAQIIDSEHLLRRINRDPLEWVDARAVLTARLADMLLNDNDRHSDQWMWARFGPANVWPWVPIARDRDKVLHSEAGVIPKLAGFAKTRVTPFDSTYPSVNTLMSEAIEFDRRLLSGLERTEWDSVAAALVRKISNPVIDDAVRLMPKEYSASFPAISGKLKARRDSLPAIARRYYDAIFRVVDIHGTDADESATVSRVSDGLVDVSIQSAGQPPHFRRRFDARETSEIRIYLHGGDDVAVVRGDVRYSIPVRIIGGNGTNRLMDSSRVAGRTSPTRLYESGVVSGVRYDGDSADSRKIDESQLRFNRRPWAPAYDTLAPPQTDRGSAMRPVASIGSGHGLGIVPRLGILSYKYGFGRVPYSSMTKAEVAYSTAINGVEIKLEHDKRFEGSSFHLAAAASMSQLEVVEFRGLGNDIPDLRSTFYDVRQRQWSFRPALGFSPNSRSDISLGPIVRYTSTDSTANRFISQQQPYGFSRFAQAGLRFQAHFDSRGSDNLFSVGGRNVLVSLGDGDQPPAVWGRIDLEATAYPGAFDVRAAYQDVSGVGVAYFTAPVFTRPTLALRAGAKHLYGNFPYFDAAFIGGSRSLRTEDRQRFAGDASFYGAAELRVPVVAFPFVLPLNLGLLGFVDAARVYIDGASAGSWHKGTGAGFWLGVIRPDLGITVLRTNNPARRTLVSMGYAF